LKFLERNGNFVPPKSAFIGTERKKIKKNRKVFIESVDVFVKVVPLKGTFKNLFE